MPEAQASQPARWILNIGHPAEGRDLRDWGLYYRGLEFVPQPLTISKLLKGTGVTTSQGPTRGMDEMETGQVCELRRETGSGGRENRTGSQPESQRPSPGIKETP